MLPLFDGDLTSLLDYEDSMICTIVKNFITIRVRWEKHSNNMAGLIICD